MRGIVAGGGTLEASHAPEGGFRLVARIQLHREEAPAVSAARRARNGQARQAALEAGNA